MDIDLDEMIRDFDENTKHITDLSGVEFTHHAEDLFDKVREHIAQLKKEGEYDVLDNPLTVKSDPKSRRIGIFNEQTGDKWTCYILAFEAHSLENLFSNVGVKARREALAEYLWVESSDDWLKHLNNRLDKDVFGNGFFKLIEYHQLIEKKLR